MNAPWQNRPLRFQRGIAAVEFALVLPLFVSLLALSVFFGRVCWHYTAAVKAAHDAARYLASVPLSSMTTGPTSAGNHAQVARAIAQEEVAGLNPGPYAPIITVACDAITCDGLSTPQRIDVTVRIGMFDDILYGVTYVVLGDQPLTLTAAVSMRYVGK
jgi:hypothetical protein